MSHASWRRARRGGLKQRTRLGNATLMICLEPARPRTCWSLRPTHRPWPSGAAGLRHLAQALLPILLTGAIWLFARGGSRRRDPPLHLGWVLTLSYVGVSSHVLLDLLNNYGVRCWRPLDWHWFYGDSVFIVDPWLWLALGGGVWLARRRRSSSPARRAVTGRRPLHRAMVVSARLARESRDSTPGAGARTTRRARDGLDRSPSTPMQRAVIVDAGDHYASGTFSWWTRQTTYEPATIPKNAARPEVALASQDARVRGFLVWSLFPSGRSSRPRRHARHRR